CVPSLRRTDCIRRGGLGRHGARALRDPLPLRPAAGNAAGDLGHQPDSDAGGAHGLRRAERAGRDPSWMSGGFVAMTGIVLPWSRIVIIAFAALVLLLIWL